MEAALVLKTFRSAPKRAGEDDETDRVKGTENDKGKGHIRRG